MRPSLLRILAPIALLFAAFSGGSAVSVAEKAHEKRIEILTYLRALRPMVMNFGCEPFPQCEREAEAAKGQTARNREYGEIKRVYQEGLVYLTEGNFINSYLRLLEAQKRTENLLEDLSQSYVDRTETMLRDAIEQKDPANEQDLTLVDISIEFGPDSKLRRDFKWNRIAPGEQRRYNPRIVHYAVNKYRIEKNMELGYHHLGLAKQARMLALTVDSNLAPQQKLEAHHRRNRIEYYLKTIVLCRLAKFNAEHVFSLKYPHDQYKLDSLPDAKDDAISPVDASGVPHPDGKERARRPVGLVEMVANGQVDADRVPEIEQVRMEWVSNPYYLPKKLNPIFNLKLPPEYRRDALDVRNKVYKDEVDMNIKFKYFKNSPSRVIQGGQKKEEKKEEKK